MPYFADQPNAFVVLEDEFVTTEEGTGIVHMAPAYGEDDFRVCRPAGIELVDPDVIEGGEGRARGDADGNGLFFPAVE